MSRRGTPTLLAAVLLVAAVVGAVPAHAASYRFWSYWTGGAAGWTFSARGPAFLVPADKAVEGWHFGVSDEQGGSARPPDTASTYDALCPGRPTPKPGAKRVAVVVDPGTSAEAPAGESPRPVSTACLEVPADATGMQVLQQAVRLRLNTSGLICGIDGYPSRECPTALGTRQSDAAETSSPPTAAAPAARGTTAPVTSPDPAGGRPGRSQTDASPDGDGRAARGSMDDLPTRAPTATTAPAPVPIALAAQSQPFDAPPRSSAGASWVTAVGVGLIAILLTLALLARSKRAG